MTKGRKIVGIWPTEKAVANGLPIVDDSLHQEGNTEPLDPPTDSGQHHFDAENDAQDTLWLTLGEPTIDAPLRRWIVPALGAIAAIGWAVFVVWTQSFGFSTLPAMRDWPMVAVMICAPIALILITNLLIERASGRSVHRHLDAMARMREEHQHLAERLSVIDQHWQQAQATLNARALTLADTALNAGQRLGEVSAALDERMNRAVSEAAAINQQGEAARRSMEALLVALPKIGEVSQRATEAMRESGQLAYQYGGQLEAQIAAVRHESTEAQQALSTVNEHIAERLSNMAAETEAINESSIATTVRFNAALIDQRDSALAMVADLAAALEQSVTAAQERFATVSAASVDATRAQIEVVNTALDANHNKTMAISTALADAVQAGGKIDEQLNDLVDAVPARIATIEMLSGQRLSILETSVSNLQQTLDALGDNSASATEHAENLARRASDVVTMLGDARHDIETTLPEALEHLHTQMTQSRTHIEDLPNLIGISAKDSAVLLTRLQDSEKSLESQTAGLEVIEARMVGVIGAQTNSIVHLQTALDGLAHRMHEISSNDVDALKHSLSDVDAHAREIVESTAGQLENALAGALDKVTGNTVNERLATIASAADNAVKAANSASERLMRQLITIADSSAALESRVSEAHATIEKGGGDTLARQMALLTEAMQSTSVDLTRLLDSDVADQTWEAYLKGDRSIFARRALRLLSSAEAKELLRRYESEEDFRTLVNRYVHDFEAMLRGIIDTRDGQQLSVTLLSSDVGKIYVALAQAIERLRN